MSPKPDFCSTCPINRVTQGYVPLAVGPWDELWVGEAAGEAEALAGRPFIGGAGAWLNSLAAASRQSRTKVNVINVLGCQPPGNIFPTDPKWTATSRADAAAGVEHCYQHHLRPVLYSRKWQRVLAFGDKALQATTGRHGILQWRGSPLPLQEEMKAGPKVIPTLHPAYLMRQASLFSVAVRDIQKRPVLPPEKYNLFPTLAEVEAFDAREFAFDFEWDPSTGAITLCGLSAKPYEAIVVPFQYPFLPPLKRIFEEATDLIGHNIIGADTKYFEDLGWKVRARLWDTMLMQHLVQPDMRHGLAFVASVFTNKVFWKGSGEEKEDSDGNLVEGTGAQWKTWTSSDAIPREFGGYGGCSGNTEAFRLYNARDTDASLQIVAPLRASLTNFGMEPVYWHVSVPIAFICRRIETQGFRINPARVGEIRDDLNTSIIRIETVLPEGLRPYEVEIPANLPAPPGTYKPKTKRCRGSKKLGNIHDSRDVSFCRPGTSRCDVCGREIDSGPMHEAKVIKGTKSKRIVPWNSTQQVLKYAKTKGCRTVQHMKTGRETGDKSARKIWGKEHTEFASVDELKKLVTLRNGFARESMLREERVYFRLGVTGTAEGRLNCKGVRAGVDPNIQNQPKSIRKIYIPDHPGWGILSSDLVQGENMLTAWLAKDWDRWERLNTPGYDEHSDMASAFFNLAYSDVCKGGKLEHMRKPGKVLNHGKNYLLGVRKTQMQIYMETGTWYSEADVKEMFAIWAKKNSRTAAWQLEVIETVKRQSFLANPFGRKRWFQGRDFATKAAAFLPASTLADAMHRMMIALYPDDPVCGEAIAALRIDIVGKMPEPWDLRIQVHDALVSQGPDETHAEAARITEAVMTQPWRELDGFAFKVDTEYSTKSWGDIKKL